MSGLSYGLPFRVSPKTLSNLVCVWHVSSILFFSPFLGCLECVCVRAIQVLDCSFYSSTTLLPQFLPLCVSCGFCQHVNFFTLFLLWTFQFVFFWPSSLFYKPISNLLGSLPLVYLCSGFRYFSHFLLLAFVFMLFVYLPSSQPAFRLGRHVVRLLSAYWWKKGIKTSAVSVILVLSWVFRSCFLALIHTTNTKK